MAPTSSSVVGELVPLYILAVTWVWAAVAKARDYREFVRASKELLPGRIRQLAAGGAWLIPLIEGAAACLLLLRVLTLPALVASAALLTAFTFLLLRARVLGITAPCTCFGTHSHEPIDNLAVVRTGFLALLALTLVGITVVSRYPPSDATASESAVAALAAVIAVTIAAVASAANTLLTSVEKGIRL